MLCAMSNFIETAAIVKKITILCILMNTRVEKF